MRIDEFASAEEQMALWKLVNDNVWQAIETQRQQQAKAAQAKVAKAKLKPRKGRKGAKGGGRGKLSIPPSLPVPTPKVPMAKKPEASANPQLATSQNLHPPDQGQQLTQRLQQAQSLAPAQTLAPPTAPVIASTAPKDGVFAQNILQKKSPPHGDDRHSANGYSPHPPYKRQPAMGMARPQQFR
jgi:hypothetical protein